MGARSERGDRCPRSPQLRNEIAAKLAARAGHEHPLPT